MFSPHALRILIMQFIIYIIHRQYKHTHDTSSYIHNTYIVYTTIECKSTRINIRKSAHMSLPPLRRPFPTAGVKNSGDEGIELLDCRSSRSITITTHRHRHRRQLC